MKIAFIGLGIMGSRMAERLLDAGHEVHLQNRTRSSNCERLIGKNGIWHDTVADAVAAGDIVLTMLSTPDVVEEVATSQNGIFAGAQTNQLWVDCSTVDPGFSRRMAEVSNKKNVRHIDAPVAGSAGPAAEGTLLFLAGGESEDIASVQSLFDVMGKKTVRCGGHGKGSAFKMIINLLLGQSMLAFSEAFALGRSLDLDDQQLFDVLLPIPVVAPRMGMERKNLETENFEARFPLKHLHKDLQLAVRTAFEHGANLVSGAAAAQIFGQAENAGYGDKDFIYIFKWLQDIQKKAS